MVVSCRTQCVGCASTQACFMGLHVARRCWPRFRSKEQAGWFEGVPMTELSTYGAAGPCQMVRLFV
jgi:glutamate/tyrosine decarboxylase-like PLP-dependent enzyme